MGSKCKGVNVISLRRGSVVVNYEVIYDNSTEAAADLSQATYNLIDGTEKITILNESVSASSITINNNTVLTKNTDSVCQVFIAANGACKQGFNCQVLEGSPTCLENDPKYELAFLVAIIVSSFAFLILVVISLLCAVRVYRTRKIKNKLPESLSSNRSRHGDYDYWSHNTNRMTMYGVIGGLQVLPSSYGYPSYMEDADSRFVNYGPKRRQQLHVYDNHAMNYDNVLSPSYSSNQA